MPNTGIVKYHVKLKFEVDGMVEKADIIGAIFGQTEGLLGPEMNLNELQKVSKVGRIEVNVDNRSNVAKGDAVIPMSTDISTAALIAAAIESIDKVGPFQAKFALIGIDDIRAIKKKIIVDRAKRIVQEWATKTISEGEEMLKDVYDASKPGKLTAFGRAQLACGSGVFDSDWIILVEGRADVINLLRAGFDNAIAIEGAKVDESIIKLTEGKRIVAFLDGDRAGDLILKELHGLVRIDKVLRAPDGREVEECTPLEISEILREAVSHPVVSSHPKSAIVHDTKIDYRKRGDESAAGANTYGGLTHEAKEIFQPEQSQEMLLKVHDIFSEINETLEAVLLDDSMRVLVKVPVSDIVKQLGASEGGRFLVLDGIVTQRLIDVADRAGIEFIVGHRTTANKKPSTVKVHTFQELGIPN
ncbi:MAG TPA: DNA primase DnaG [Nitrososphaeraceae archaeon]|nr:DNA primase DnaG [Nitrososphaeraceae archaeon]